MLSVAGEIVAIMHVLEFPINASFKRNVSLEDRNPTFNGDISFLDEFSERSLITEEKVARLWLTEGPSLSRSASAPAFDCRSLPAKSTRLIFACDTRRKSLAPAGRSPPSRRWIFIVKMACDLEDFAFICVAAVTRRFMPKSKSLCTSAGVLTTASVSLGTTTPVLGKSIILSSGDGSPDNRSRRVSLWTSKYEIQILSSFVASALLRNRSSTERGMRPG
mmetsp:Transcript_49330/g.130770  ORF Transcript_49330/g.130770 Transcript_49330/m.130770 type:complete len:220 (+) Transcript_49330:2834-3493(+)